MSTGRGTFLLARADTRDLGDFPVIGPADAPPTGLASIGAEARYRALIGHLPDTIVALYDHDLRGVSIDGPRLTEVSYDVAAFEGEPLAAVMPPADYER